MENYPLFYLIFILLITILNNQSLIELPHPTNRLFIKIHYQYNYIKLTI